MYLIGKVLNQTLENRELTNKEGKKESAKVAHVVLMQDDGEIANVRSYNPDWTLPEKGAKWTSPRVRKYECFDGMIADVSV